MNCLNHRIFTIKIPHLCLLSFVLQNINLFYFYKTRQKSQSLITYLHNKNLFISDISRPEDIKNFIEKVENKKKSSIFSQKTQGS